MCTVLTIKVSLLAIHSLAIYFLYLLAVSFYSYFDIRSRLSLKPFTYLVS